MRRTFSAAWPATAAAWGRFQPRTTPPCWWSPQGRRPTGTDGPSAAAWPCCRGTPPPGVGAPGGQRRQLRLRPQKHPHPVQPGGAEAVAGPPAGAGHHPGPGGGPAGVPLDSGPRRLPTVRPGGGRRPPPAGSAAGTALRPPFPGIAGNCIRLLTNLVSWYTIIVPLPWGVLFFEFALVSTCA